MLAAWEVQVRGLAAEHIGFLGGNHVVERFTLFRFTRRHPELVGLTPVVRRVNDDVTLVIADLVGVGGLAGGRLNAIRTHILAATSRLTRRLVVDSTATHQL
jgi:hypothetical protein